MAKQRKSKNKSNNKVKDHISEWHKLQDYVLSVRWNTWQQCWPEKAVEIMLQTPGGKNWLVKRNLIN